MLGVQWAGVEVYPPQRLVVDYVNFYHLWCTPRKLQIGWDDDGVYSVDRKFYTSKKGRENDALPEIAAARLLKDNQEIVRGMLEGHDADAILRDLAILPGGDGENRSADGTRSCVSSSGHGTPWKGTTSATRTAEKSP